MSPLAWAIALLIRSYRRFLSPMMGRHCRFHPTCSAYALEAVTEHGGLKGTWLALRRIARCHPFAAGGVDHVPARKGS